MRTRALTDLEKTILLTALDNEQLHYMDEENFKLGDKAGELMTKIARNEIRIIKV